MQPTVTNLGRFLHHHLVWLLLGTYAVGALWPEAGLWIRGSAAGQSGAEHGGLVLKMMLALLLLNAGLGVNPAYLKHLAHRWPLLAWGIVIGLAVPVAFVLILGFAPRWLPLSTDYYGVLVGLAIVAAMPVAGSSTAWSQNAQGNLTLSLGLLLASTILSPLTAPVALRFVAAFAPAEAASIFAPVLSHTTTTFLTLWTLVPAAAGLFLQWLLGAARIATVKPYLVMANLMNLLLLNYANASLSLPSAAKQPNPGFWLMTGLLTAGLAVCAFSAAEVVARWQRGDRSERMALCFACGMKNNGAGLVLAATALVDPGIVLVPILLYNLVQHLAAALVDRFLFRAHIDPS